MLPARENLIKRIFARTSNKNQTGTATIKNRSCYLKFQPEKSTILLVAEAWHATGMAQEASRILVTINRKEMTSQKETVEKQIPVGNLEKPHRNQTAGVLYSNILQIPSTVTSDHKGSPATLRKGRMVLREDGFPVECSWLATRNMSLSHSCKFGSRLPVICLKHSLVCMASLQSCTAVFLNWRKAKYCFCLSWPSFLHDDFH